MDQRRILIVDHDEKFALAMATALHSAGYQTALAHNVNDAQLEIENRNPLLVVLRAELPQQSGFALTGVWKKRYPALPILLIAESNKEALEAHRNSPNAAHGYLRLPFKPAMLVSVVREMLTALEQLQRAAQPPRPASEPANDGAPEAAALDLIQQAPQMPPPLSPPPVPPPMPSIPMPPPMPKRERRSAITEDDRGFLSRTFASIAERKAELLADAAVQKRPPISRKELATPEGKLQVLRDELRQRESQIARISEIWTTRDREQLAIDDRLHEKEIEVETCKRQIQEMVERFAEAQQAFVKQEQFHGATIDDLLLQKFSQEKDLIEVVASKEKELNLLKRELQHREDDLYARENELDQAAKRAEIAAQRECDLNHVIAMRETEIEGHLSDLDQACKQIESLAQERDERLALAEKTRAELEKKFSHQISLREHSLKALSERIHEREVAIGFLRAELDVRVGEEKGKYAELQEVLEQAEMELGALDDECQKIRSQRDGQHQSMTDRISERDATIEQLSGELAEELQRAQAQESELSDRIASHLEKIGELEGQLEALQAHSERIENELSESIDALNTDLEDTQAKLVEAEQALEAAADSHQALAESKDALENELRGEISDRDGRIAELKGDLEATIESKDALENELRSEIGDRDGRIAELQSDLESLGQAKDTLENELRGEISDRDGKIAELQGDLEATIESKDALENELRGEISDRDVRIAELNGDLEATFESKDALEN
jgi:CheY-like chemotaxis protein/chromosome segregation ATPase